MNGTQKIIFLLALISVAYIGVWSTQTRTLRKEAIDYIHNTVYAQPPILKKVGEILPEKIVKLDAETVGNKYLFRLYESVQNHNELLLITAVVKENGKWSLVSLTVTQNGKPEILAEYGQWR